MELAFTKYQGTGNDFVMIDGRQRNWEAELNQQHIARICDRHFGVGADGLIILKEDSETDFRMVYYNADGRESSMCGNGGRCLVAFAREQGLEKEAVKFIATDGLHEAHWVGEEVRLKMTPPHGYHQRSEQFSWVDTGSPHLTGRMDSDWQNWAVREDGALWRHHQDFSPGGTNVNFYRITAKNQLQVRTFERGVEDETLSCGTGVTACAYVYWLEHLAGEATEVAIETLGGSLKVGIEPHADPPILWLTGPAKRVFSGIWTL
ncbi:MAG: diaminopimelate epimerase [Bacteroidota bacterium]